jgi:hypothetical protein
MVRVEMACGGDWPKIKAAAVFSFLFFCLPSSFSFFFFLFFGIF